MMYDVCVIGSGAGAGPIIYELSQKGLKVCVLEKGDIYTEKDFSKDEMVVRKSIYTPNLKDEYHTIEEFIDGSWQKFPTYETGWNFWNGSLLGGSSNFMSGYFHRLKPNDFKLASSYEVPKDSNIVDWPISYDDMEKYYEKVERVVGISGKVQEYEFSEPRSTKEFPYSALEENKIVDLIDKSCKELNYKSIKTPRAIITKQKGHRNPCYYSNYCGSYPCSSAAKGSSRASLIKDALLTNNVTIIPNAFVIKLNTNKDKKITSAVYLTKKSSKKEIKAKLFVLAAQAVETSRLLLNSKDENFPNGVANNSLNVGKNFLSSSGGIVSASFDERNMNLKDLLTPGLFVNRTLMDWYYTKEFKAGTIDILFEHANPIRRASNLRWNEDELIIGEQLQNRIFENFTKTRRLNIEIFTDWTPNDNSFISVDEKYKDKYAIPVANIRIGTNPQDLKASKFLEEKAIKLFEQMGAKDIKSEISQLPSGNLQAGGCRFGNNPKTSVLNKYCQAHEVSNLFVTDGSFMPTGGSVPFTWTIYANSFRVADYIKDNFENIIN
ncbi:MAG: GMC family oxidoreductase [Aliarcobacter sp.]|nr:GMC family oxidoreductase [Aliarcobacter sp.]